MDLRHIWGSGISSVDGLVVTNTTLVISSSNFKTVNFTICIFHQICGDQIEVGVACSTQRSGENCWNKFGRKILSKQTNKM